MLEKGRGQPMTNRHLSKREKAMLYIFICFLIVTLGISFLVLPAISHYTDLNLKLNETQATVDNMRQTIERIPQDQADVDTLKEEIEAYVDELYEPMPNDEIDQLITNLMIRYGLTPIELKIQTLDTDQVAPYLSAQAAASSPNKGLQTTNAGNAATPTNIYSVVVQAEGQRSSFYSLSDEVSGLSSMRLTGFDIQENEMEPAKSIMELEFAVITYAR
jgi:hypothetical protein